MRTVALLAMLVACARGGSGMGTDAAGGDDVDAAIDAPPGTTAMLWRDDTQADFSMGTVDRAAVEPEGAIASGAYYTGGLLVRASDSDTFAVAANATWAGVTAFTATAKSAIARSSVVDYVATTPQGLGLTAGDTFTMWFEGEVFLDVGTYTFELIADDHGFLELAPSATGAFQRIASADLTTASGQFTTTAAGWYPIRYAISEDAGNAVVQVRATGPGLPVLAAIPRHRLRSQVNHVRGLFQSGFDDGHLLGDTAHTIDATGPGNTNWAAGRPADLGMTADDDFSSRWAGQFRVDMAGAFTFRYVSDDGQRAWVDGQKLLDTWDDATHDATTAAVTLDVGWHDIVIDHTERGGGAAATFSVATGPELVGMTLPVTRLRPVEGRGARYEAAVDHTDRAIADLGQTQSTTTIVAPTNVLVVGVDVSYQFNHTFWGDLEIRLIAPNGATALIRDNVGGATSGIETQRQFTTALNTAPVGGTWTLRVNDTLSGDSGTLLDFQVTPHYVGGEFPIATTGAYDSAVKDLGNVVDISKVSWVERLPTGADVAVRMRTCATMAGCATEMWSAPITNPTGGKPVVMPRRFAQYRVEFTSNGDRAPSVDAVQVDYLVSQ